ncbi:snare-like protein, partial [Apiospora aurea]
MAPGMSLFTVNAIIVLSVDDGSRIFAKYYNQQAPGATAVASPTTNGPYPDVKSQKSFEKGLLEKTAKQACAIADSQPPQTGDIILYDNRIVLYKMESDVMMYVVGDVSENEVLLYNVILALRDSLHLIFKQSVDKRTIIENYDLVSLAIDEIVDDGIILETDPTIIVQRVSKAPAQDVNLGRIDLSEQGSEQLGTIRKGQVDRLAETRIVANQHSIEVFTLQCR